VAALKRSEIYPILVHCEHGVTRTSKFLAIYDISMRGMSADESLEAQPLFGRETQCPRVEEFARAFEQQLTREHAKMISQVESAGRSDPDEGS
jgi:hypothetical protein